jgi:hypothetical protein
MGMNTTSASAVPIMLYLPLAQRNGPYPWEVFHDTHRMGTFRTQDECFRHAIRLAESLGRYNARRVRLKIEDESGGWETVDAFDPER